jgi:hypothetical protein
MKIINPLYDQAFKYLMENNKLARKALSIMLDVEVEELILEQQETVITDKRKLLNVLRMDFKALIKEADGSRKTVLIEVQKSKYSNNIDRFRHYLGSNYMSAIIDVDPVQEPLPERYSGFPIITIYILGYNLPDLPYMAVTVNREVINSVNKKRLQVKSFFIEHLTHQSHIIQVLRLPEKRKTRLEKFLSLFNQQWCTDVKFILDLPEIPSGFTDMAKYLQGPLMDDEFRRKLRAEQEIDIAFDRQLNKYLLQLGLLARDMQVKEQQHQEAVQQLQEAEQQLRETEQKLRETEQQKRETEQQKQVAVQQQQDAEQQKQEAGQERLEAEETAQSERLQKLDERTQKLEMARKFARYLMQTGASIDFICNETGLNPDEIAAANS